MIVNVGVPRNLDMADSYGLLSAQLIRHLARLGCYVNVSALGTIDYHSLPSDIAEIATQPRISAGGGVFIGYPTTYRLHKLSDGPKIGITMFESSRIPPEWVPLLNELDAIVVPSHFCKTAFVDSGVTKPISVVPLGVGESYRYKKRSEGRPLTFLSFLDRGERKGGVMAEQAFLRAFGGDENYKLIQKGRKPRINFSYTNPNIELVACDMSEAELAELYGQCDILLNPCKGEGFGLIPREFAATGGIALTTPWGGTADDLDQWGFGLPYTLEKARWDDHSTFKDLDLGEWATHDPNELAECLKDVAEWHPNLSFSAKRFSERAIALYSWGRFAARVLEIWQEVQVGNSYRLQPLAA